jgi:two-component system OmpR family sensor kinase
VGRLFWKFFAFFMLAQVATVVGVSSAIWLRHRNAAAQVASAPAAAERIDVAAAVLGHDGEAALRALLADWSREPGPGVYAIDTNGSDILGRPVRRRWPDGLTSLAPANPQSARRVVLRMDDRICSSSMCGGLAAPRGLKGLADGNPEDRRDPESGRPAASLFPVEPIVGGLLASLVVAALLAWYVSKPIRSLRSAFDAAAGGDLDVPIGDGMGRRRDELADLGGVFDRTAVHLKLLMDGQRRLLQDVSHELRSPLARLQAAAGLARQQPGNIEASMDRIEREAMRMDKLVDGCSLST